MKAKKGEIIMTVTIGLICFVLTYVMFMQFKVVEETDITQIENARESDLREKLASWTEKYEDVEQKLTESKQRLEEYNERKIANQETTELVEKELEQARQLVGITDVKGAGVVVTLEDDNDSEDGIITSLNLRDLVEALRLAGAEAISINDIRVINMTEIVDTDAILVNTEKVASPYVVKAIGDQKYLESALNTKTTGYIDTMIRSGKKVTLERENNIKIYKYNKELNVKYLNDEGE